MSTINLKGTGDVEAARTTRRPETIGGEAKLGASQTPAADGHNGAPQTADKINVSNRVAQAKQLTERAKQLPDIRRERVENLRERISSNIYHPPASDIANAIINSRE